MKKQLQFWVPLILLFFLCTLSLFLGFFLIDGIAGEKFRTACGAFLIAAIMLIDWKNASIPNKRTVNTLKALFIKIGKPQIYKIHAMVWVIIISFLGGLAFIEGFIYL